MYFQNAKKLQEICVQPRVLKIVSEVIFNSKNFDSEQVLRISVDMLKTMPELCNYIENNEVLFTNFINSILETKTTDNLKLHFQVLMEVYTAS